MSPSLSRSPPHTDPSHQCPHSPHSQIFKACDEVQASLQSATKSYHKVRKGLNNYLLAQL